MTGESFTLGTESLTPQSDTGTMHDNAAREATKKRPVFGRLLSLSATYVQGSAMAATGEWRDEVGCSKLTTERIARTCRPLIALIQRLHKLY